MRILIASMTLIIAFWTDTGVAATTLVTGARIYTMGPQGVIENGTLLIEDGRIRAVGAKVELPAGATVIDAAGKIVTPGLFVPFSALGLVEIPAVDATVDKIQRGGDFSASFDVADAYNRRSAVIGVNRVEGITRALIAPVAGYSDDPRYQSQIFSGLAAVVDLDTDANYLTRRGAAMVVNLGAGGGSLTGGSRAAALQTLTTALDDARDYAKHREDYDRAARRSYSLSRADLEALQPALQGTLPLIVNVDRASDIEILIALAHKYRLRVIIHGGAEAWMVAEQLAAAKIAVIVNPLRNLPASFDALNASKDAAAILAKAGVVIAFSDGDADGQTRNARNITQYAGNAVAHGLPWIAALEAITLTPARLFGVDNQLGSLEKGKAADFVIWSGDPLELTNYPDAVYIDGHAVPMTTRQTLLRDRYLKLDSDRPPAFN